MAAQETSEPKKRRGPARTGQGAQVQVRFPPAQIAALDAWIAQQTEPFSRPEAIRAMVGAMLELMARNEASGPADDSVALDNFLDRFEIR